MKKENRRVLLTKQLLKEALLRLLETKSIEKINVSELCREADVNRATFYHHFSDPHDVLVEVEQEIVDEIGQFSEWRDGGISQEEFFVRFCTYLDENAPLLRVLIRYNAEEDLMAVVAELNRYIIQVKEHVGPLASLNEESIGYVSTFYGCGVYSLLRRWILAENRMPPEEIAALLCRILRTGQ